MGEELDGESGDEGSDEDRQFAQGAHSELQLLHMRRVVEAVEFSVRNVGLSTEYYGLAGPEVAKLQSTCRLFANQSISDKWQPEFVALLKKTRMCRIRPIPARGKDILRKNAECCQICGTTEHLCDAVIELIGTPAREFVATPLGEVGLKGMASAYNSFDDADDLIGVNTTSPSSYFGMFSCGQTCFEKVVVVLAANNFVSDVAYSIREKLDVAMARNPSLVTKWEADERDPNAKVTAITDDDAHVESLLKKVSRIEDALRGGSTARLQVCRTGNVGTWRRVDAGLMARAGGYEHKLLAHCSQHAKRALLSFGGAEPARTETGDTSNDESESEPDDEPDDESESDNDTPCRTLRSHRPHQSPQPPQPQAHQRDLVSSRTRAGRARSVR